MRVLIVAHVGETLGHLADGLAIAGELQDRGCLVEFISANSVKVNGIVESVGMGSCFRPVRWAWSHNSCALQGLSSDFLKSILDTVEDLETEVRKSGPDLILSLPGFASAQIARKYGIPHMSILHGVHLAPIMTYSDLTPSERAVLAIGQRVCLGPLNDAFSLLHKKRGLPEMDYSTFLQEETICVPQPGLAFKGALNITETSFIRASIGPAYDGDTKDLEGACYVTFGSGNRCDLRRIILLAREVFPRVVANTCGLSIEDLPDGVVTRPYIASYSVAPRIAAVVSHGGVGTVGTFAEWGLPHLIIPTEFAQASMAIEAQRAGIASHLGLEYFKTRARLGREMPEFTDEELRGRLADLRSAGKVVKTGESSGAAEIAEVVLKVIAQRRVPVGVSTS